MELALLRARLQEGQTRPLYKAVVETIAAGPGVRLLHSGCGAGTALSYAAEMGATVAGVDHSQELLELAELALPEEAGLRLGDTGKLPHDDGEFDAAMSFTRLQFAPEPAAAVNELVRVTRPGGLVAAALWDLPASDVAGDFLKALHALLPAPPVGDLGLMIGDRERLASLMRHAGLEPVADASVPCPFFYVDAETAWHAMRTCAPVTRAVEAAGEETVREVFMLHCVPRCEPDGSFRPVNLYHYAVGRVPS